MSARVEAGQKTGLIRAAGLLLFAAAVAVGCGSSPPRDQNYGTDLGADYKAPVVDASGTGGESAASGEGGAGGSAGSPAGEGGAAGTGVTGLAGADGAAGAAGAGS